MGYERLVVWILYIVENSLQSEKPLLSSGYTQVESSQLSVESHDSYPVTKPNNQTLRTARWCSFHYTIHAQNGQEYPNKFFENIDYVVNLQHWNGIAGQVIASKL